MVFFFFSSRRRHTRLQGDWSSDVCSSDLAWQPAVLHPRRRRQHDVPRLAGRLEPDEAVRVLVARFLDGPGEVHFLAGVVRSEERRVGKECRCWWGADKWKRERDYE